MPGCVPVQIAKYDLDLQRFNNLAPLSFRATDGHVVVLFINDRHQMITTDLRGATSSLWVRQVRQEGRSIYIKILSEFFLIIDGSKKC